MRGLISASESEQISDKRLIDTTIYIVDWRKWLATTLSIVEGGEEARSTDEIVVGINGRRIILMGDGCKIIKSSNPNNNDPFIISEGIQENGREFFFQLKYVLNPDYFSAKEVEAEAKIQSLIIPDTSFDRVRSEVNVLYTVSEVSYSVLSVDDEKVLVLLKIVADKETSALLSQKDFILPSYEDVINLQPTIVSEHQSDGGVTWDPPTFQVDNPEIDTHGLTIETFSIQVSYLTLMGYIFSRILSIFKTNKTK